MAKKGKTPKQAAPSQKERAAEAKFVEELIARGEAVPTPDGDSLPPGATHLLVKDDGGLKAKRIRFAAS
ncbi:MAG: hypothetical protein RL693_1131 [Verrucomicrobiota bacterium]|jgi:hypothetical protein